MKASERYALISLAVGAGAWLDIHHWFPEATNWIGFVVGLVIAGSLNAQLLQLEADTRISDGTPPQVSGTAQSLAWAAFWFALVTVPVLAD